MHSLIFGKTALSLSHTHANLTLKPPLFDAQERGAGEAGLLVCRGANLMSGYVGAGTYEGGSSAELGGGWYLGFGDVCFWLPGEGEGGSRDFYWVSRDSALLIRGGANYAYDQVRNLPLEF